MKKILIFLAIIALQLIKAKSILGMETEYRFEISAYVLENGEKTNWGSGGFTAPENKYGRVSFTFFKGIERVNIIAAGDAQVPVTRLLRESEPSIQAGEIFLTADLYLMASLAKEIDKSFTTRREEKHIRLKGFLIKLTQVESKGAPLFKYSEEKLDFVLPNNSKKAILLEEDKSGRQIYLDLLVRTKGEMVYKEKKGKIASHVTFNTEYYLYNQDAKEYELENKGCILGLDVGVETGKVTCFNQKVYRIERGDSLLYLSAYEIKNPTLIDTNKIEFKLEVTHTYALNPIMDETWPKELKSEKTTVILFNKEIIASTGGRIEIEIPQDKGSLLPFKSKETIVLTNSVKEVKIKE